MSSPARRLCPACGGSLVEGTCAHCAALSGADTADPLIGAVINGAYRVDVRLASGGLGRVYRGLQLSLRRPVAIKFLHPTFGRDPHMTARFLREARATSAVSHPNVVRILDVGVTDATTDGQLFLVMELLVGEDLEQVIRRGPLPLWRAVDIVCQALAGLAEAHSHGIVHRDVKPDNVVLEPRRDGGDLVKIIDFGLARVENVRPKLSVAGQVIGSPAFLPPEVLRGAAAGPETDVYAMGAILYELLTGTVAFGGRTIADALKRHDASAPKDPRTVAPNRRIPAPLAAICLRAIHPEPRRRFASAQALASALRALEGRLDRTRAASSRSGEHGEEKTRKRDRGSSSLLPERTSRSSLLPERTSRSSLVPERTSRSSLVPERTSRSSPPRKKRSPTGRRSPPR